MHNVSTHIDFEKYNELLNIQECFHCKKEIRFYLKSKTGGTYLNPAYFQHLKETHGYPTFIILDQIEEMYKTDEAKESFRNFMKEHYSKFKFMEL